jgi:hypothetical protein
MANYATNHQVDGEEEIEDAASEVRTACPSKVRTRSRGYVTTLVSGHSNNLADMLYFGR